MSDDPTVNLQPASVTGRKITPADVNTSVNAALTAKESQTDALSIGATVAAITPRVSAVEQTASTLLAGQSSLQQQITNQAATNTSLTARLTALEASQAVQDNRLTTLETATPPSPSPPGQPSQPSVSAHTSTSLTYTWTAPVGGTAVDHYIPEIKLSTANTWTTLSSVTAPTVTKAATGLANLSSYDFRVTAVSAAGFPGTPSLIRTASTDAGAAVESADGTTLTTATGSITDASGHMWKLIASVAPKRGPFQIEIDQGSGFVVDPVTQGVVLLKYYNPAGAASLGVPKHSVVQQNDQGAWYYAASLISPPPGANYTQIAGDPAAPPPSGVFSVKNGRIIDPNGNDFVAKGVNVADLSMSFATKAKLQSLFPGLNMIRLAVGAGADGFDSAQATQSIINYVNALSASPNPIVVNIEDHWQAGGTLVQSVRSGAHPLYTTLANALKTNTYAWFGSFNEPGNLPDGTLSETTANHVAMYNAVRATGATNMCVFCTTGGNPIQSGGTPFGTTGSAASYAGMTNVVWDHHAYNWMTSANTSQSAVDGIFAGFVTALQNIATSADGVIPVHFGETGFIDYAPGGDPNTEVNGGRGTNQVVQAVIEIAKLGRAGGAAGSGGTIWLWNGRPMGWATVTDVVASDNATLTQHGVFLAQVIAAN